MSVAAYFAAKYPDHPLKRPTQWPCVCVGPANDPHKNRIPLELCSIITGQPAPITPEPVPAPEPTAATAPAPVVPETPIPDKFNLDTVEGTLNSIGVTYPQLVKLATELNWWPTPEAYPTIADLSEDLCLWIIRNKRGIGRAVMKAGGAL